MIVYNMAKMTENAIQKELIRWIRKDLAGVSVIPIRNEDMRKNSSEIETGHPDLELKTTGPDNVRYILALELKTVKGALGENQIKWNKAFDDGRHAYNHTRAVGYGLIEAMSITLNWLTHINPQPEAEAALKKKIKKMKK